MNIVCRQISNTLLKLVILGSFSSIAAADNPRVTWTVEDAKRVIEDASCTEQLGTDGQLCNFRPSNQECAEINSLALEMEAIDQGAYEYLEKNGWFILAAFKKRPVAACKCPSF